MIDVVVVIGIVDAFGGHGGASELCGVAVMVVLLVV